MIVFQSPASAKSASYQPCYSPSPGGSNERSECRFVCCSGVGRDEGELNLRERSERHFLYRPFVSERDLSRSSGRQPALNKVGEYGTRPYSRAVLTAIPSKSLCLCGCELRAFMPRPFNRFHSRFPRAIQGYSSPFNPIQGVFKKDIFFLCGLDALVVSHPRNPRFRALPAKAGQKADRFKPMQGKKLL